MCLRHLWVDTYDGAVQQRTRKKQNNKEGREGGEREGRREEGREGKENKKFYGPLE